MTTLRLTAIRCLCRDRGLERVKDSVVLKKVMSVKCYGSTSVSKTESRGSTPCTDAKLRSIAQLGSALALGARGRRFESYYSDQIVSVAEWLRSGLQIHQSERHAGSSPVAHSKKKVDKQHIDAIIVILIRQTEGIGQWQKLL